MPLPGYYFSGDGALRDEDGCYRITGRVDDMINSKGHVIGTAELECAMVVLLLPLNVCNVVTECCPVEL